MTEMMTNRMRMMTVVTMCLLFASLTHIGLGQHVFDINHVNSRGVPIRNLAYDKEGDTLFVGANSTILALDGNLTVKQVFQNYSIQNENLVLKVIGDDTLSYLLSCGTYIGVCEQRNLENISNVEDMIRFTASSTVSNNEVRVVSFTNDGKEKYILFYVRTYSEFDTISYYPINTLQLKNMKIDTEARDRVGLRMINNEKGKYSIEFKAVLESDSFVYFLSQQNESSKLSKQCKSDYTQTNLYEDIYISCKHGEQTFRYIQDGVMLELGPGQFVLVALFTDSAEVDQSTIGALCVFTENEIQESFLRSRKDRLQCPKNELPYSIFQFDELPKMCVNLSDVDIPSIYIALVKNLTVCDPKLNDVKVIVGLIEMTRTTNVTLEKGPEKMAARWANGLHTVYVGTFVGVVNQYYIYMDSENHGTRKFVFVNSIPLNGNKKPVTDIKVFDDSVFVATEDKVFRLPDKICEKYNSCLACMSTESINCGWCILEQKCTEANVDQCKLFDKENQWLPSVKGQCLEMRHTNSLYPFSEENSVAKQTQLLWNWKYMLRNW